MSPAEARARIRAGAKIAGGTGMTQEEYVRVLPTGAAADFVGAIELQSAALALGNTMKMSEATERIPVVSFLPQAGFVNERYGGRKPATEIKWDVKEIAAEEIAATVPVPNAWIADTNFDVEGQVEKTLSSAVAKVIDDAILFGSGAPATFPSGGVAGAATLVSGTDALDVLSEAMSAVEEHGLSPDGIAARSAIGAALRTAYREAAALPGERPALNLWGVPVAIARVWDASKGDAIVGGWEYLAIGIREDVTFGRSTEGVLLDAGGDIIANAFQDNLTLIKIYCRIGAAIGRPVDPATDETIDPFARAKWTK